MDVRRPNLWKRNVNKLKRARGEESSSHRGEIVRERAIDKPCKATCRRRCSDKIDEKSRRKVFTDFYNLNDCDHQDQVLAGFIQETP